MFTLIQNIDINILEFVQKNLRSPISDFIMTIITHLGDIGIIWIVIAIIFLITKKYRKTGVILAIGLIIMLFINNIVLKTLINRVRPFIENPDIKLIIPIPSGSSFPSGHTASSFTAALCISKENKHFAAIAYILAILISFSRVYLYVHYPSDILGGMLFGTLYAVAAIFIVYIAEIFIKKGHLK